MTVNTNSLLFLGAKNYRQEKNLNFTHDALQEMRIEIQTMTF